MTIVNITDLENITLSLLGKLKQAKGNNIELTYDFYWEINRKDIFDPYSLPEDITLGQISEDWSRLNQLVQNDNDSVIHDLERVAIILKALSIEFPIAF